MDRSPPNPRSHGATAVKGRPAAARQVLHCDIRHAHGHSGHDVKRALWRAWTGEFRYYALACASSLNQHIVAYIEVAKVRLVLVKLERPPCDPWSMAYVPSGRRIVSCPGTPLVRIIAARSEQSAGVQVSGGRGSSTRVTTMGCPKLLDDARAEVTKAAAPKEDRSPSPTRLARIPTGSTWHEVGEYIGCCRNNCQTGGGGLCGVVFTPRRKGIVLRLVFVGVLVLILTMSFGVSSGLVQSLDGCPDGTFPFPDTKECVPVEDHIGEFEVDGPVPPPRGKPVVAEGRR